jgi:hypothetical protein
LPVTVRAAPEDYLSLELRAHELWRDVPLYDVSVVDLPGGGDGRSLADALHLQAAAPRSLVGYEITLVKDATADYSAEEMHAALDVNIPNYASAVVTTDQLVDSLFSLSATGKASSVLNQ